MSIKKDVKYCRLILILCKCGKEITRAVFQKEVQNSTPDNHEPFPWTVDHFLDHKREDILKHEYGRLNRSKLFPGYAKAAKFDEWDITLLCFLLLKICSLHSKLSQDIECLRQLRNKLVHRGGEIGIPDKEYDTYMERINGVITRCSQEIGNTALCDDMQQYISQVETLNIEDVTKEEKILKQWYETEDFRVAISIENTSAGKYINQLNFLAWF